MDSRNIGEANKYFDIYTKDFGLIRASAQGVRKLESKNRFNLQDYFYIKLDLVKGREVWRITSASKINFSEILLKNPEVLKMTANIFRLLQRLCQGEDRNEILFGHLIDIYNFFENESLDFNDLKNFECVSVVRILHSLGYIGSGERINFFATTTLARPILEEVSLVRQMLIQEINKSLKESHL